MSSPTQPQAKSPVLLIVGVVGAVLGCLICTSTGIGLGYVYFGREPGRVVEGKDKGGGGKTGDAIKKGDLVGKWVPATTMMSDPVEFKADGTATIPIILFQDRPNQMPEQVYDWSLSQEAKPILTLTIPSRKGFQILYRAELEGDTLTLTPFEQALRTQILRRR
jgi:hypothetical protein